MKTFIQVVRVPAYISTIISAPADEGPDEMTCFIAGLHYLLTVPTRMSEVTPKSVCYATLPEKGILSYQGLRDTTKPSLVKMRERMS